MDELLVPYLSNIGSIKKQSSGPRLIITLDSFVRRGLDIFVSFFGLLFLAPLFIWIAARIKKDSPGPVFFRGRRSGLHGREFGILKFRTMYENPGSYAGSPVTAHDDPRITAFGKWLRDTKINELPQLWNVLTGEMSLVGPRPEDPDIVRSWPQEMQSEILSIRPGITSPATVLFRDEETRLQAGTVMDDYLRTIMPSKLRLDSLYINNRNILTDLDVLFWTSVVLLPAIDRLPVPESKLYWGPLSLFTSRYLSWFLLDLLVAFGSVGLAGVIWRTSGPLDIGIIPSIWLALGIAILFSLINTLFGMNEVEWSRAPAYDSLTLALSTGLSSAILLLLNGRIFPQYQLPTAMLLVSAILALAGFVVTRYKDRLLTGLATRWLSLRNTASAVGERVILVGAGQNCQMANWFFGQSKLSRAFSIIGIIDDDPRKQGLRVDGYRVLGTTQDIPEIVRKYDVGIIYFTISNISKEDRTRILKICQSTETILVILPDMMETFRHHFRVANTTHKNGIEFSVDLEDYQLQLAELDRLAESGDLETLRSKLASLRASNAVERWEAQQ